MAATAATTVTSMDTATAAMATSHKVTAETTTSTGTTTTITTTAATTTITTTIMGREDDRILFLLLLYRSTYLVRFALLKIKCVGVLRTKVCSNRLREPDLLSQNRNAENSVNTHKKNWPKNAHLVLVVYEVVRRLGACRFGVRN